MSPISYTQVWPLPAVLVLHLAPPTLPSMVHSRTTSSAREGAVVLVILNPVAAIPTLNISATRNK